MDGTRWTYVQRSLGLLGPDKSLQLFAQLRLQEVTVPCTPKLHQMSGNYESENLESPILPNVAMKKPLLSNGRKFRGTKENRAPTYRELMRFSAFREWVSQRSVRASSSARSCSQVSLLGAPINPMDKGNKDWGAIILEVWGDRVRIGESINFTLMFQIR